MPVQEEFRAVAMREIASARARKVPARFRYRKGGRAVSLCACGGRADVAAEVLIQIAPTALSAGKPLEARRG